METKYVYVINGDRLLKSHSRSIRHLSIGALMAAIGMYALLKVTEDLEKRIKKLEDKEER